MSFPFKVVLWDFDGVIIDSNHIRESGFIEVLDDYPRQAVEKLIAFHRKNGGLSRYVKFDYFFNKLISVDNPDHLVNESLRLFSDHMKRRLVSNDLIINDSLNFIKKYYRQIECNIVSASDQSELRYICQQLSLSDYFKNILGSPLSKDENVRNLIGKYSPLSLESFVLIGDSINDYHAAIANNIEFIGYNNSDLRSLGNYCHSFEQVYLFRS